MAPTFLHSPRGARAAAHLLQGLQVRRSPDDRPSGRAVCRHPHRPRGSVPSRFRTSPERQSAGLSFSAAANGFFFHSVQIRTSINQHVTKSKEFSWIRHIVITVALLAGTNTLVILVPTIRDIFGFVGRCLPVCVCV